jgi:hypothetical protein
MTQEASSTMINFMVAQEALPVGASRQELHRLG